MMSRSSLILQLPTFDFLIVFIAYTSLVDFSATSWILFVCMEICCVNSGKNHIYSENNSHQLHRSILCRSAFWSRNRHIPHAAAWSHEWLDGLGRDEIQHKISDNWTTYRNSAKTHISPQSPEYACSSSSRHPCCTHRTAQKAHPANHRARFHCKSPSALLAALRVGRELMNLIASCAPKLKDFQSFSRYDTC